MKNFFLIIFLSVAIYAASQNIYPLIPAPVSLTEGEGSFVINRSTYIAAADMLSFKDGIAFRDFLITFYNYPLKTMREKLTDKNYISIKYDSTLNTGDDGYILKVTKDSVILKGKNKGGVFHGLISLLQLFTINQDNDIAVPCCEITDYPRFQYRGMHLDCSRHFFDVVFIKKYIDYLALYKYNTFHWHLTDDQGWRIEIKQYPLLTSVGGFRNGTMKGHYREQQFDTIRYGGFYTQNQIKDIVKYAEARHITIIPEIEMPGHCVAALAAYPQFGCIDTALSVGKAWGGYASVFCPKEETFTFLENILDEVMALFPSAYIHIGGDEVEKTQWKKSKFCQQLIKDNDLIDENGLQNYFIQRIGKYVNSKGKKIIGWDEILDGGIAPDATIMSWRGEEGGIKAAEQDHYAIMTPGSYCYFDYYQGSPIHEPMAIGGYVPLDKVYSYDPIPEKLDAAKQKYILGAQANLWTEYISSPEQVEYMIIPRMLALSEVLWSPKENKNYDDLVQRLLIHYNLLRKVKCNYSKTIFLLDYKITPLENNDGIAINLINNPLKKTIYYSFMNLLPDVCENGTYEHPVEFHQPFMHHSGHNDCDFFQFYSMKGNSDVQTDAESMNGFRLYLNIATGKKITLTTPPSKKYEADGAFTLVNGIVATTKPNWAKNEWLGFSGTDCEATIDLGKKDTISKITIGYLEDKLSWIWIPSSIEISASADGNNFTLVSKINKDKISPNSRNTETLVNNLEARFIKIKISNYGTIPPGNPGAGKSSWLFVDEISVE